MAALCPSATHNTSLYGLTIASFSLDTPVQLLLESLPGRVSGAGLGTEALQFRPEPEATSINGSACVWLSSALSGSVELPERFSGQMIDSHPSGPFLYHPDD